MMQQTKKLSATLLFLILLPAVRSDALTAEALVEALAAGEAVVLVDVRSTAKFQRGHIPSAINVPARMCEVKTLPPLGRIVVYGDGYDSKTVDEAAQALGRKDGIQAEVLEGGYSRWRALRHVTTEPKTGLTRRSAPLATYDSLRVMTEGSGEVVIVDMRGAPSPQSQPELESVSLTVDTPASMVAFRSVVEEGEAGKRYTVIGDGSGLARAAAARLGTGEPLELNCDARSAESLVEEASQHGDEVLDLRGECASLRVKTRLDVEFPRAQLIVANYTWGRAEPERRQLYEALAKSMDRTHCKVYVLIDDGDGRAQTMAEVMQRAGLRRYFVFGGGEKALRQLGQTVLERK